MRKRIWIHIVGMMLSAVLLCSCGGDELHYLDTTTAAATAETEVTEQPSAPFLYTPSDDGVVNYNYFALVGRGGLCLQYHDGYLYFLVGKNTTGMPMEGQVPYLVRMNVETGNVTAVCPDPVCVHDRDSGCPMYGVSSGGFIVGPDGKYYVLKIYTELKTGFVMYFAQYDAERNVLVKLNDGLPSYANEFYTEHYRFYKDDVYDEETQTYYLTVLRTDLTTGESVPIWKREKAEGVRTDEVLFVIGDRLYLTDYACLYSVNFDGEDRRVHIEGKVTINAKTDGEYVYYIDQYELCRRHLEGGAEERLGIFPYHNYFELTEKYVYYRTGEDVVLGKARIRGYTSDTVTLGGENLCRYPLSGEGGEEIVYTFAGETANLRPSDWLVVGNYCYCTYTYWEDPDGDGIYRDGDEKRSDSAGEKGRTFTFLRIDLTTDEVDVIAVDEYGEKTVGEIK